MTDPEADLLKVSPDAPLADIKKAFRKAALAHHPDQNPHPEAARHFRRLTEADRSLEARALLREPPRSRQVSLGDRVEFVLGDVRSMVRRWPADRWTKAVDGLPAVVWVTSALDVLAQAWPGAPAPVPTTATVDGIAQALEAWKDRLTGWPLDNPLPRAQRRPLVAAVEAAEGRLKALERLTRAKG